MEISRWIFAKAFLITVIILIIIYSINLFLNSKREIAVTQDMDQTVETLEEMETLTQLMQMFGDNATCVTLKSELSLLDKQTWKLGSKLDDYQRLSQEYMTDPYYLEQKRKFNRQEVLYLSLLRRNRDKCSINQSIILYFYKRAENCSMCDQQAFVLTHMNQKIDEELAIFSFDTDLDIPSVSVLTDVYNVTEYPCIVIEDQPYCGMRNQDEVERHLCEKSSYLSICGKGKT